MSTNPTNQKIKFEPWVGVWIFSGTTVEPLLSCSHLRGKAKWPLKRGWLLNRVRQKLL